MQIFCKSNETDSIFGAKCEGKSTMLADAKTISICEGSFQRFGRRTLKTEASRAKLVQAFGCLGTAIAVSPNKSANNNIVNALMVDGLKQEDLDAIANTIASMHVCYSCFNLAKMLKTAIRCKTSATNGVCCHMGSFMHVVLLSVAFLLPLRCAQT